jgi:hypothetical protein
MKLRFSLFVGLVLATLAPVCAVAQTVSPIITEYREKGEGRIQLTNDTLTPLVVLLQAQSFSIRPDGTASYRPLDPGIHVDLSTTSVRILPKQQYFVFYKAHSDSLPAWFTIYATFTGLQRGPGINLRIMLPHTVYLYQKQDLRKEDVKIGQATYDATKKLVICDVENISKVYGRMREGSIDAGRENAPIGGFPLLPANPRRLELPWTGKNPPETMALHFDKFEIKIPVDSQPPTGTK